MPIAKLLRTVFGIESADSEEPADSTSVTVEREPADEDEAEADPGEPEVDTEAEADPGEPEVDTEAEADPGEPEVDTKAEADIEESDADTEAEADTGADAPTADSGEESVESVSGIGPAYAERLEAAGIETVADLLAADPEAVAAESDLSEKRVSGWQDAAEGE